MILTTHAIVGAALGKNISNPWLIIIIATVFHFFLDHFKHGEYVETFHKRRSIKTVGINIFLDVFAAITIITSIMYFGHIDAQTRQLMFIGIFFSLFPDFLTFLYWKFNFRFLKKLCKFHAWCHKYPPYSKERMWNLKNAKNDILFSIIAIIFLVFF